MTIAIMIHITTTDSAILIPPKMGIVNTVLTLSWSINSSTSPFVAVTSFFSLLLFFERRSRSDFVHEQGAKRIANVRFISPETCFPIITVSASLLHLVIDTVFSRLVLPLSRKNKRPVVVPKLLTPVGLFVYSY